jgi:hypothetical protein
MSLFLCVAERFGDELIYELVLLLLLKRSEAWCDRRLIQLRLHYESVRDFVHLTIELLVQVCQSGALRNDLIFHIADKVSQGSARSEADNAFAVLLLALFDLLDFLLDEHQFHLILPLAVRLKFRIISLIVQVVDFAQVPQEALLISCA